MALMLVADNNKVYFCLFPGLAFFVEQSPVIHCATIKTKNNFLYNNYEKCSSLT